MIQDPAISFLLGSGFSKPAGFPLAPEINRRFVGIKESDFSIHTSGTAWFNNGKPDPNDWFTRKEERQFVERLLDYYCNRVVTPETFHYETFYDWYKDLQNECSTDPCVEDIAAKLDRDIGNALLNFNFAFNQLLANSLGKRFPEVHLCQGLPESHARFLDLVKELSNRHALHFHSLNHDLFFESLSSTDAMQGELADGFSELGSPYYGKLAHIVEGGNGGGRFSYTVRLPRFVDKFDSRFNLYKLHGSVDHYVFRDDERATVKNEWGVGPDDLMKEVGQDGHLEYKEESGIYHPDFLSGIKFKTRLYESTPYYQSVFQHFKSNLERSSVLVVIGYGFGDAEINRLLKDHFLTRGNSRILIVDICEPKSDLLSKYDASIEFFIGGVSGFDYTALLASILAPQPAT